jgi:hypothetical protein
LTEEKDRELLVAAYANFNARAIDSALRLMHPEVDWPNGMEGGRVRGHQGVREYWTRQWALIDPHAEPLDFHFDQDGQIAVTVHLVIRGLDGAVIADENVRHTYLIEDGLIRRMEISAELS